MQITGLATGRELASANVKFQGPPGSSLETPELTVPLADLAARWYQDPAGAQFGSLFTLVLPFTVNGDPAAIESVTVTLVNQMGASQPATARRPRGPSIRPHEARGRSGMRAAMARAGAVGAAHQLPPPLARHPAAPSRRRG